MATENCATELAGLLLSLSVHHPSVPVVCFVDEQTKTILEALSAPLRVKLHLCVELGAYAGKDRKQMEAEGIFKQFTIVKADVIAKALELYEDTMFLDSDIIVTAPIDGIDKSKQLGMSPHYIRKSDTDRYGIYNAGVLWTNQKSLPATWRALTPGSRFFEQGCMEELPKTYTTFDLPVQYNMSWWRLHQAKEPAQTVANYFSPGKGQILYKKEPIRFVHTHFLQRKVDPAIASFNSLIMNLMLQAGMYRELTIIGRIANEKFRIHIPKQPMAGHWTHTNDSFREEAVLLYKKNKDIDLVYDDTKNIVLEPSVMLYDRDTLQWFYTPDMRPIAKVYLGNCDLEVDGTVVKQAGFQVSPWIYWPRRPMILEALLAKGEGARTYEERLVESLFIGNYENAVQQRHRTSQDWSKSVTEFHLTGGTQHKFTPKDYLLKLAQARFGLCLRGYGVKCHREVELMAFGTVPIATPNVDMTSYLEPLKEGVHYIRVKGPEEVASAIAAITPEQWQTMSDACKDWYKRNVHSDSMWRTFLGHLLYDSA